MTLNITVPCSKWSCMIIQCRLEHRLVKRMWQQISVYGVLLNSGVVSIYNIRIFEHLIKIRGDDKFGPHDPTLGREETMGAPSAVPGKRLLANLVSSSMPRPISIHRNLMNAYVVDLFIQTPCLPLLPSGLYIITNVGIGQSAGQPLTKPTIKPIIGTDERPIWRVEHVEENRYHLNIHGFVTREEDNLVFSYLAPEIIGTEWIIQGHQGSDRLTIVIPDGHMLRFWTLSERDTQVSLKYREGMLPGPNQYWEFTRFVYEE
ncbi:hypothetical protein F5148DRAFT_1148923 [Russula earlei]|uniref:Uncharacterized protein n=1 Tax=Russula earlei TaxID=71964 RepID=A0ACC0UA37_9AGAM|nr:hypothetical protein F5148DRAFT_1148923 [Russula earlei]